MAPVESSAQPQWLLGNLEQLATSLKSSGQKSVAGSVDQGSITRTVGGDGLAARYSGQTKEAAKLFTTAEKQLDDGKLEEAAKAAAEAITAFRKSGDHAGLGDALRVNLGAMRQQGLLQEANDLARRELDSFKASNERRGQGCMLLSLAEISQEAVKYGEDEEVRTFHVVADRVVQRERPHKNASSLGIASKGNDFRGVVVSVSGIEWLKIAPRNASKKRITKFLMIDGTSIGLDKLLEESVPEKAEKWQVVRDRVNSAKAMEMLLDAKAIFKEEKDTMMEAITLLSISNAHLVQVTKRPSKDCCVEAEKAALQALEKFKHEDSRFFQGQAYHALALACVKRGLLGEGIEHSAKSLEVWRELGYRRLEGFEQNCLAMWHLANRAYDSSLQAAEAAQSLFKEKNEGSKAIGGEPGDAAAASAHKVQALLEKGDVSEAVEGANACLTAARSAGDSAGEASALLLVSSCLQADGRPEEALAFAKQAVTAAHSLPQRSTTNKLREAAALQKVASIQLSNKDFEDARDLAFQAVLLCDGHAREEAKALSLLCDIHIAAKTIQEALEVANESRDLFADAGDLQGEATACLSIAAAKAAMGEGRRAANSAKTALELAIEAQDERGQADAYIAMGRLALHFDTNAAANAANKGRALVQDPAAKIPHLTIATKAAMLSARWEDALHLAAEMLDISKSLEWQEEMIIEALHMVGQAHLGRKAYADVNEVVREGLGICEELGDVPNLEGQLRVLSAEVSIRSGRKNEATEILWQAFGLFEAGNSASGKLMAQEMLDKLSGKKKENVAADSDSSDSD